LVPIRLDLELDGAKLRDTFTWNLNETLVTPDIFADLLCTDLALPPVPFAAAIAKSIRDQVADFSEPDIPTTETGEEVMDRDELRTVVKLDITIGSQCLVDQFEWDINCGRNQPEIFAEHMTNELGLHPEFRTAIAHSIREQIQSHLRSLFLADHPLDGTRSMDDDLAACFLPPLTSERVLRGVKGREAFGPFLKPVEPGGAREEKEASR
ncbi:hypothetical protein BDK51DRAFT_18012, partial [Blyttiomyces helicus]